MLAILLMSKARDLLWKAQQSLQYVFLPMYTTKDQMHNLILIVQWWANKGAKTPVTILAPGDYLLSAFLEKSFLCYLNECVLLGSFASQAAADILTVCLKADSSARLWLTWIFPEVDFSCWLVPTELSMFICIVKEYTSDCHVVTGPSSLQHRKIVTNYIT